MILGKEARSTYLGSAKAPLQTLLTQFYAAQVGERALGPLWPALSQKPVM